jgi:hypothetical protein
MKLIRPQKTFFMTTKSFVTKAWVQSSFFIVSEDLVKSYHLCLEKFFVTVSKKKLFVIKRCRFEGLYVIPSAVVSQINCHFV